jgi:glycosyltransferase involved in cell wall biosynthesis
LNNYPGWLAGLIKDHQCGFSVEPEHPVAFANVLEQAAADKSVLKPMGENARKLAETVFNRQLLADQWVAWVTGARN